MTSRVTVKREDPANPVTVDGLEYPGWTVVYTDLPFRSDSGSTSDGGSRGVTIGSVTFEEATGVGHFPHPSADLRDGDVLEVATGDWAGDWFQIVAAVRYDQQTARRLPIKEAQRPEGWEA